MGKDKPSKHLVQLESFFHPISNIEEFYLADFDYFMEGNPFFRQQLEL
jgi:hypothetical protein